MEKKIRVLVADDQRFARMYVEMNVGTSSRYELCAALSCADEVPAYLSSHQVDLVILDVVMERGNDGLTVAAKIKKEHPEVRVILATSMAEAAWMERAKEAGVESFWYKEYSKMPLIEIMDRTMNGESVYTDEVPEMYLGALAVSDLTEKQKDLLCALIEGLTNREIAEKLYLSVNTVKSYLDDIMDLSGIHSRTELAVRASKLGLNVGKNVRK